MSKAPPVDTAKSETVSILLVEDDDGYALLVQRMLSAWRYGAFNIRRAENLSAARRQVAEGGIDLVLLDLGLPDSRGIDTFLCMRKAAAGVPIIVLSGLDDEALANTTVQQGAQDYIVKGHGDASSMARAIRYAIERSRAQQALAEKHDLLRSVLDNIPDQVYLKDTDSRFVSVNPVTARFFGAESPDQIVGKCDFDFFPRELAAQFLAEEQALFYSDQPCVNREEAVTDSAGNTRWVLTTKVPLRDHAGNITGLLGINHDITERRETEEATRRLNAELERRVTERTGELRKAVVRLEELDLARNDFVSNVSHELKTPLASIMHATRSLLTGVAGPLPEKALRYVKLVDGECYRLLNTVQDVLDLRKLEGGGLELVRVHLPIARLVIRRAQAMYAQAVEKGIQMVMAVDKASGFVHCDGGKMERVVQNIVANAIKFTPQGGQLEIGLSADGPDGRGVLFTVEDDGVGIPKDELPKVTQRYYRAGNHAVGSGLGLAISREIVEMHGGRIQVASPPPGEPAGTFVSVWLPTALPPVILVIDNDTPWRAMTREQLLAYGYRLVSATNAEEGLKQAAEARPCCVVLNAATGHGAALRMKSDEKLRQIPMVAALDGDLPDVSRRILKELAVPVVPCAWQDDAIVDGIEAALAARSVTERLEAQPKKEDRRT